MSRTLLWLCGLNLVVVAGLIGMLLGQGFIDLLMLMLACSPMLYGAWCWWRKRA